MVIIRSEKCLSTLALLLMGASLLLSVLWQGFSPVYIMQIQSLLMLAFIPLLLLCYRKLLVFPLNGLSLTILLVFLWQLATVFFSQSLEVSVYSFCLVSALPVSFFLYTLLPNKRSAWRVFSYFFIAMGLVSALLGIYQQDHNHVAPVGFFVNRNTHAAFINVAIFMTVPFLTAAYKKHDVKHVKTLAWFFTILTFVYLVALTVSRGAICSLFFSTFIMAFIFSRNLSRNTVLRGVVLAVIIFIVSALSTHEFWSAKFEVSSGVKTSPRLIVWKSSFDLLRDTPWYGIGLGNFPLYYHQYRVPEDISSGYYAHNDYLQAAIEQGYPGLLLQLALYASLAVYFYRFLRRERAEKRLWVTSVFCALTTFFLHSLVTFNFFILPLLMVVGFLLGFFHERAIKPFSKAFSFSPALYFSKVGFSILSLLFIGFIVLLLSTFQISQYYFQRAWVAFSAGNPQSSYLDFVRAGKLFDTSHVEMGKALVLMSVLDGLPKSEVIKQKQIFKQAAVALNQSIALNRRDADLYYYLGNLHFKYPALSGSDASTLALSIFSQGMSVNPAEYLNYYGYARVLVSQGKRDEALDVLNTPLKFAMPDKHYIESYLTLLADLYGERGDHGNQYLMLKKRDSFKSFLAINNR